MSYAFPPALKHGDIREIFKDVFFVTGTVGMTAPIKMHFSRNMTILREGDALTLINSIRLDEKGLERLESLGTVKNIIRLAGAHGMDDPFYKDRYNAKVYSVKADYTTGLDPTAVNAVKYFSPDVILSKSSPLPVKDLKLIVIESGSIAEGLLLHQREGGIIISGDCMQNWAKADEYFSWLAKFMMKFMGFFKAHNVGPAWLKQVKPDVNEIKKILDLDFKHVLPAHGGPVFNTAKELYKPAIENL